MREIKFFTLVFLSWAGIASAQVVSFPENDAIWREEYTTIAGPFFRHYGLCGDTLINGKTYSQLLEYQVNDNNEVISKTYQAAIRSEGSTVWAITGLSGGEVLLYDFSLQAGQQLPLLDLSSGATVSRIVDSVAVENIAGADRRVIYFKATQPGEPGEFWIEGFGSNYGVLWRAYMPASDLGFALLCFQYDDVYLNLTLIECFLPEQPDCGTVNAANETAEEVSLKLKAFPNPASGAVSFAISGARKLSDYNLKIYAANGKLLKMVGNVLPEIRLPPGDPLSPGFYIAVLETKEKGRVVAHCTFVTGP